MAHFAELDKNNIVISVQRACNIDIANNGGELSEQAAQHFSTITPLSKEGIKYVQTSYNNNFRKKYAAIGDYYDPIKDKFIGRQPYSTWILDNNDDWQPPIAIPTLEYQNNPVYELNWNNSLLRWEGKDYNKNSIIWDPNTSSWS